MPRKTENAAQFPEDLTWTTEVAVRYRTHSALIAELLNKIREAKRRIRIENIEFRRYEADLNRDYPLFPNG